MMSKDIFRSSPAYQIKITGQKKPKQNKNPFRKTLQYDKNIALRNCEIPNFQSLP